MRQGLFENRPLAALCLALLLGLLFGTAVPGTVGLLPGLFALLILLSLPFLRLLPIRIRPARRRTVFCALLALFLTVGTLTAACNAQYFHRLAARDGDSVSVRARIEETVFAGDFYTRFYGELLSLDGEEADGRISWEIDAASDACTGDIVEFSGVLHAIHDTRVSDDAIWRMADGILADFLDVQEMHTLSHLSRPLDGISATAADLRKGLASHLTTHIEGEAGKLMAAMLLGVRDELSPAVQRDMRRLGLSHILAISGLHLSILIGCLTGALRRVGVSRRISAVVGIVAILFYMLLTGFPLSLVRSGVMLILALSSFFFSREPDSITSLSVAAVLICLLSRFSVYDLGLWLSVTATLGILLCFEYLPKRMTGRLPAPLAALCTALLSGLGAILATLPITALTFGELSLLALPANLLISPLFSLYLILSLAALLLAFFPPAAACLSFLGNALLTLVHWAAAPKGILIAIDYPAVQISALLTAALAFLLLCTNIPIRRVLALCGGGAVTVALCLVLSVAGMKGRDLAYFSANAKNENLLLVSDGSACLVDISYGSYAAMNAGISLLDEAHLTELELYFLTHYHARTPATLSKMADKYRLRRLCLPTPTSEREEEIYRAILAVAEEKGLSILRYEPMDSISLGRLTLRPHAQGETGLSHASHGLTVLLAGEARLTYLSANAAASDARAMAEAAVSESEILIFGTHGSAEREKLDFPRFSARLRVIVADAAKERFPEALYTLLAERAYLLDPCEPICISLVP